SGRPTVPVAPATSTLMTAPPLVAIPYRRHRRPERDSAAWTSRRTDRSTKPGEGVDVGVGEFDRCRGHVLLKVRHARRAGDRKHRGGAPQQPGERELRGPDVLLLRDAAQRASPAGEVAGRQRRELDECQVVRGGVVQWLSSYPGPRPLQQLGPCLYRVSSL